MRNSVLSIMFATTLIATASTSGLAQTTGPSGQQDTNKVGAGNPASGGAMTSGNEKSGMSNTGMTKNSPGSDGAVKQGGESKDGMGSDKGGMSK